MAAASGAPGLGGDPAVALLGLVLMVIVIGIVVWKGII